jgi:hypothetical protein
MKSFFIQLTGQIHPSFRRVDMFVEIKDQIIGNDGISCGKKSYKPIYQMPFAGIHFLRQICDVSGEVHLVDGPRVLNGVPVHLIKRGITHGTEG